MADTRAVKSPGVFAADATTTIPGIPDAGVSYRDTSTSEADTEIGWPFAERVDSAEFNQIMFQISSLLQILDQRGMLGWTAAVDYAANAYVLGSNGVMYRALQASGPATAPQDPVTAAAYWARFGGLAASVSEVTTGVVADKWVSPATLLAGVLGQSNPTDPGYARLPFRDLVGVRRDLIVQWGSLTSPYVAADFSFVWPVAFPNACLRVVSSDNNSASVSTASIHETSMRLVSQSTTGASWRFRRIGDIDGPLDGTTIQFIAVGW